VRSLRAVRGRFVICTALLVLGGLLILLSADWRNKVIAPGPLASPHAQLFDSGRDVAKCSSCHAAADDSVIDWIASLLSAHGTRAAQSQLCLDCHDKTISPEAALTAHNLPPAQLLRLTGERAGHNQGASASVVKAALSPGNELQCAACHREHHGANFDLTAMDNGACQTCHQQRYESFATDHPNFSSWPHERRTRIRFSHASHRTRHFADKKVAFECRNCHVEDAAGDVQLTLSYEATCAACHDEKIATSVAQGIPMFALPTLDVDALREGGHDIGHWPEKASGDFDGRLPPVMKLLLASDPAATRAMITLGDDFDFFDVNPEDSEQLAACATIAGAIKQLMLDLGSAGTESVRERLMAALGGNVTTASVAALTAGLSDDTLRGAAAWVQERDASSAPESSGAESKLSVPNLDTAFGPGGTWFRDDATLSLRYRPAAHADLVLVNWLQLMTRSDLPTQPIRDVVFKELADPAAPGLCVSCHSVEQISGRALTVNWRSYDRRWESRPFTKFSHRPHLLLPQLADCTECHTIVNARELGATYIDLDPHKHVKEFKMMPRRGCAECHTPSAAGDRCQSCHNYHVSLESEGLLTLDPSHPDVRGARTSSGTRPGRR
jgi:predicted CXXCH cytochrome family protein